MELRHLRYFIAVAEEEHVTRAAERLGMQQPPLSQRIKAMERELDVQLFHRRARGVELTDAGRAFLDNARAVLARLDHTFETTRRTARGEQGRISIGIVPASPFHPLVPQPFVRFENPIHWYPCDWKNGSVGNFWNCCETNKLMLPSSESPMRIRQGSSSTGCLRSRCSWHCPVRTHWRGAKTQARSC